MTGKKVLLLCLCMALLLTGCGQSDVTSLPDSPASSGISEPAVPPAPPESSSPPELPPESTPAAEVPPEATSAPMISYPTDNAYLNQVIEQTAAEIMQPGMSEYELVKAAFDYMIVNTVIDKPVGFDLWRIRCGSDALTSAENRALSVLVYHIGMCEDYAPAFTLLLQGMGLEAKYMPGITYSVEGALVDHAWTMAKVDGVWYHVDSQLEDNITRRNTVRYKYFMRGDATLSGSHWWGQRLIDAGLLTPAQNAEVAANYLAEAAPQDYPRPEPYIFEPPARPTRAQILAEIETEVAAYEAENGALQPLEPNLALPVFGMDGYGPPD